MFDDSKNIEMNKKTSAGAKKVFYTSFCFKRFSSAFKCQHVISQPFERNFHKQKGMLSHHNPSTKLNIFGNYNMDASWICLEYDVLEEIFLTFRI